MADRMTLKRNPGHSFEDSAKRRQAATGLRLAATWASGGPDLGNRLNLKGSCPQRFEEGAPEHGLVAPGGPTHRIRAERAHHG